MKRTILFLVLITIIHFNGNSQVCVNCDGGGGANSSNNASVMGVNNTADGIGAIAGGKESKAYGDYSVALGYYAIANNGYSFAIGKSLLSFAPNTFTIGNFLEARVSKSFVLGRGYDNENRLINLETSSMMIGFSSTAPTLYISEAATSPSYKSRTGKIAIGNVVNSQGRMDPQAKLHLRADDGEEAAIFIEPNNWDAGETAKIILGDTNHFIITSKSIGVEFNSSSNFVFNGNNTGFGVEEPKAKVHINGDLLFEHNLNGIIMKSEDGNCWKGRISNNGELIFSQVDCGTLTSTENITEPKHSEIFIYPNPTNGQITVEYTGNRKNLRLEIKSISGHLVATYKIKKGENRIELNNISDQMIVASVFTKKGELISTNKVVIKK